MTGSGSTRFSINVCASWPPSRTWASPGSRHHSGTAWAGVWSCRWHATSGLQDGAHIGLPELHLGSVPAWGGSARLVRAIGRDHAMNLILRAKSVPGPEALDLGLVTEVCPNAELKQRALDLAGELAALPATAMAAMLRCLVNSDDRTLDESSRDERAAFHATLGSLDMIEGMTAFLGEEAAKVQSPWLAYGWPRFFALVGFGGAEPRESCRDVVVLGLRRSSMAAAGSLRSPRGHRRASALPRANRSAGSRHYEPPRVDLDHLVDAARAALRAGYCPVHAARAAAGRSRRADLAESSYGQVREGGDGRIVEVSTPAHGWKNDTLGHARDGGPCPFPARLNVDDHNVVCAVM